MTGRRSIRALLEGMQHLLGWEPIIEDGNIIGLFDVTGGGAISLEPGGQFELSGAPVETVHQTCAELMAHLAQLQEVARPLGIGFLGLGMTPTWTPRRHADDAEGPLPIMTAYMPKVGTLGLDMMYRTCTVQTNLDFSSEADMVKKLRVSLALQPVATALFANSPFTEGKPNGFLSFRSEIWRDTDNDRTGMLPWAFEPGMGFERWVDYALDVPMYFVKRGDSYIDVAGKSFRDLLAGKLPGCRASAPPSPTGPTTSRRFFRRCGSSAISRCAAPTAARGGGCRRCRPIGSACSTTTSRSMPPGSWSRTGPPRSGRSCATTCRRLGFKAAIRGRSVLDLAHRDAAARAPGTCAPAPARRQRPRRDPLPAPAARNSSRAASRRPRSCWKNSTGPGAAASSRCSTNTRIDGCVETGGHATSKPAFHP